MSGRRVGAVRPDPDRDAPVLPGQVARREVALRIAGRRLGHDLQDALGHAVGDHEPPRQFGGRTRAVGQQLRRRRADLQSGRRSERLVQLLAGRWREDDVERHLAGREPGRRPLRTHPDAVGGDAGRLQGTGRQPGQPMRGRLDDHEPAVRCTDDVARLGEPGRDRLDRTVAVTVARRDQPYGAVVRVRHEHRSVRQPTDAERMLEQRGRGRAVHQTEVEESLTGGGVHLAVEDPADR